MFFLELTAIIMSTPSGRWEHAWRDTPIMLGGGICDETVMSHLGGAGGGAWQLLQYMDRWDAASMKAVCHEFNHMVNEFKEWKQIKDPEWKFPLGKLQGRVEKIENPPSFPPKTFPYIYTRIHAVCKHVDDKMTEVQVAGSFQESGSNDGPAHQARFKLPSCYIAPHNHALYICDTHNHTIRKYYDFTVSTAAGKAEEEGSQDGQGDQARLSYPQCITCLPTGHIMYFLDDQGNKVRTLDLHGNVGTLCKLVTKGAKLFNFFDHYGTNSTRICIHTDGSLYAFVSTYENDDIYNRWFHIT